MCLEKLVSMKIFPLQAYLASLHSDPSPIAVKQSCSLAHIFLYTYTMDFEKLPHSEVSPAIKAAQECATVIKTRSTNPKVIESAEKLLYHILNKAIKKVNTLRNICNFIIVFILSKYRYEDIIFLFKKIIS